MKTKNLLKYVISSWGANNFCAFISHLHFSTFISAIQHFNLIYICSFIFYKIQWLDVLVRNFSARNRARNLRRTPYQSQNRHYLHQALLTGQSMMICELKECDFVFASKNEYLVIKNVIAWHEPVVVQLLADQSTDEQLVYH